jgi:putative ABC transport system ATP-binding protein
MNPIVKAENISRKLKVDKEYIDILNDISLEIPQGSFTVLMGPSGSGKSTLLGIIGGIDKPNSGSIIIDDVDITNLNEKKLAKIRNEKIGIVFQSFNLISALSAKENVEAPLYVNSNSKNISGRAREMLDLVGLSDRLNHLPKQLSGGQQQRVAIARALINKPKLIVADEPTGNLDSATGKKVLELFELLRKDLGITLVIATHDPEIAKMADQVINIKDGRII